MDIWFIFLLQGLAIMGGVEYDSVARQIEENRAHREGGGGGGILAVSCES